MVCIYVHRGCMTGTFLLIPNFCFLVTFTHTSHTLLHPFTFLFITPCPQLAFRRHSPTCQTCLLPSLLSTLPLGTDLTDRQGQTGRDRDLAPCRDEKERKSSMAAACLQGMAVAIVLAEGRKEGRKGRTWTACVVQLGFGVL